MYLTKFLSLALINSFYLANSKKLKKSSFRYIVSIAVIRCEYASNFKVGADLKVFHLELLFH